MTLSLPAVGSISLAQAFAAVLLDPLLQIEPHFLPLVSRRERRSLLRIGF
jgi:hypothetical protein